LEVCDHSVSRFCGRAGIRTMGFSYQSDPSGNYGGWKATAIGANNQAAQSILKQEYKNDMELGDVVKLAIKVLNKSMDSTSLTSEKLELATVSMEDGKLTYKILDNATVDAALKELDLAQPAAEAQ